AGLQSVARPLSRWTRALAAIACCAALGGCGLVETFRHPAKPFAATPAPPPPDYGQSRAWLTFPGRNGPERSTPPGLQVVDEASAPADLFFVHPTTYLKNDVWNAPYDADAPYNGPVVLGQIGIFNGCCRLYAPHYRQASLHGLKNSPTAVQLAYGDVARAFRYYIEHENHGRPFIIAAHSQGAYLAVELLQREVLPTRLRGQLVAAYVIGTFVPSNFGELGLPTCESARQTGCIVGWNTSQTGRRGALIQVRDAGYWWQGGERKSGVLPAVCINPLTWTAEGAAPASANAGSLGFPEPPYPQHASTLEPLWPHLTGAVCKDKLLNVDVPHKAPKGYHDSLALLFGSYHRNDFGLFYAAIRQNAVDRVAAFAQASGGAHAR
ncbi:MAG TPA: DUF3089 domain-containing protein, partial [Phenylobacterium sp.]|nr:DUF3089 domain-containing protein [Phenylobacterium sp.]